MVIGMGTVHLVDNGGEMVLMHRRLYWDSHSQGTKWKYDAYRVDVDAGKTVIGRHRAVSVSPTVFSSVIADAVYPSFEFREKTRDLHQTGAYRLADGSIEPSASSYDISSAWLLPRPYTIADFLSLHIAGYQTSVSKRKHHFVG
jgi:hypothetical protein